MGFSDIPGPRSSKPVPEINKRQRDNAGKCGPGRESSCHFPGPAVIVPGLLEYYPFGASQWEYEDPFPVTSGGLFRPVIPYPPVAILCFCQGPVFHAQPEVSHEQFPGDIPGMPGHGRGAEFPSGPGEAYIQFLLHPHLKGIGLFPDPEGRDQVRAPAQLLLPDFPDVFAPLAPQGIEERVHHIAST